MVYRSRTGRKGPYAVYYLHLEPGSCFIGELMRCSIAGVLRKIGGLSTINHPGYALHNILETLIDITG